MLVLIIGIQKKEEEKVEPEVKEELIAIDNHDGEGDLLKDDNIRITIMKKKYEWMLVSKCRLNDNRVNLLIRYYALNEPITNLSQSVRLDCTNHM